LLVHRRERRVEIALSIILSLSFSLSLSLSLSILRVIENEEELLPAIIAEDPNSCRVQEQQTPSFGTINDIQLIKSRARNLGAF